MAQHTHEPTSLWWPEERIKSTLDTKYIVNQLQPPNVPRLFDLPKWGEGLTSETYMEYILLKAGRLFLILNEIGIPDRIFALVDESCDDDDLPIAEQNVDRLGLSPDGNDPSLDTKFFHTQWRFSVRGIGEGEHVSYTGNEGVPVEVLRTNGIHNELQGRDDSVDKVVLAGSVCRVFMRTQVQVGGAPHFFSADEVLAEIRALRKLAHEHVMSIYASYFVDDSVSVLFTGAETDRTLHSFLTDEPPAFKRLPKEQRRQTLITWPHCLVSGLSWLHAHGHFHGAIRPSNVLVDPNFQICLGQFHVLDSLLAPPRVNDLESYHYAAPERWVRTAAPVHQVQAPSRTILPSGGRTGRRKKTTKLPLSTLDESSPDIERPSSVTSATSAASKGTVIRIGLPGSPSRFSFAFSSSSSSSASSAASLHAQESPKLARLWNKRPKGLIPTPSITSSTSSSSHSSGASIHSSTTSSTSNTSLTNWQSIQTNPAASDLFSLAAIILDIITHLCKRSLSSFASHRAARNRSAGRGGGMADASFHLPRNSIQVQSWVALLEGDALKRCRRDRGSDRVFWAVPRMLIVLRAMLAPEPDKRPTARRVQKSLAAAIREIPVTKGVGGGDAVELHCGSVEKAEKMQRKEEERAAEFVREEERRIREKKSKMSILDSSSVSNSDFDFGFEGSDSEVHERCEVETEPSLLEVDEDDLASMVDLDRISPQLALPDLDVHLTGIERLTIHA
ncbi:hypothetical protein N7520_007653 [Penicillium odoratum]|uniref:uncharacterized protein n=1 Tax=Penicillium odoratum TaxID=1167516 RepID=UPI0025480F2A|nr:uncharacterized protein N7520_007653 [Penicillium odoratum]KAJ5760497.1 hypothetical protein N7520_007653 [Penicillium odoratum]